jgi:hypothetical protein
MPWDGFELTIPALGRAATVIGTFYLTEFKVLNNKNLGYRNLRELWYCVYIGRSYTLVSGASNPLMKWLTSYRSKQPTLFDTQLQTDIQILVLFAYKEVEFLSVYTYTCGSISPVWLLGSLWSDGWYSVKFVIVRPELWMAILVNSCGKVGTSSCLGVWLELMVSLWFTQVSKLKSLVSERSPFYYKRSNFGLN